MLPVRTLVIGGLVAVLTACSSSTSGRPHPSEQGRPRTNSPAPPSPTPTLHGSPADWQHYVDAAMITTEDLSTGFKSAPATDDGSQTQCPSLRVVADSRTSDVAYRRVRFALKGTGVTVDEIIAVSPNARSIYTDFAATSRRCARFQSTSSAGDVIKYAVVSDQTPVLGDQTAAVWVTGTAHNSTGTINVGGGFVVARAGPVLMQIITVGIPPPSRDLAGVVAKIAARKLAGQDMP